MPSSRCFDDTPMLLSVGISSFHVLGVLAWRRILIFVRGVRPRWVEMCIRFGRSSMIPFLRYHSLLGLLRCIFPGIPWRFHKTFRMLACGSVGEYFKVSLQCAFMCC